MVSLALREIYLKVLQLLGAHYFVLNIPVMLIFAD